MKWLQAQENTHVSTLHEELANILSTSRVVISRTLKDLQNKGEERLSHGSIEIM